MKAQQYTNCTRHAGSCLCKHIWSLVFSLADWILTVQTTYRNSLLNSSVERTVKCKVFLMAMMRQTMFCTFVRMQQLLQRENATAQEATGATIGTMRSKVSTSNEWHKSFPNALSDTCISMITFLNLSHVQEVYLLIKFFSNKWWVWSLKSKIPGDGSIITCWGLHFNLLCVELSLILKAEHVQYLWLVL